MSKEIIAIKVKQWLNTWDDVTFNPQKLRRKPNQFFYLFSISAKTLKKLSGVYRRSDKKRKSAAEEFGIQRKHDPERSELISEYVKNGYPWSELSLRKRESGSFDDLKQPGWLPTAIVVNILNEDDKRRNKKVSKKDLLEIEDQADGISKIKLPVKFNDDNWIFEQLPPIEIIDGQHRLWAFENPKYQEAFDLPVVAFLGLDISWQAYLFYTINISPKKINRSLAYDLYPLLRTEEWLEKFEGHAIYRETRAQDLVDLLFSNKKSPWHDWINMLGDTGKNKMVSQSAWIRSFLATYVRSYELKSNSLGGLFGAKSGSHETVLPWGKEEQAALIIYLGNLLKGKIKKLELPWANAIRRDTADEQDPAFYGKNTLLNQDQGIRAFLHITNDFLFLNYDVLKLEQLFPNIQSGSTDDIVSNNLSELNNNSKFQKFTNELILILSKFDWRSFSAENLSKEEEQIKAGYRGSGGYRVLRKDIIDFVIEVGKNEILEFAIKLKDILGEK